MGPRILLATSCRWYATARLAIVFAKAGCRVDLVSPHGHPAAKTNLIDRQYTYNGIRPHSSFQSAIDAARPDLIISCDDYATIHLRTLHTTTNSETTRKIIERSFGNPESYPAFTSRTSFLRVAGSAGVAVPHTEELADLSALRQWFATHGFPAYLKVDGTSGGVGVKLVTDIESAEQAFRQLSEPPHLVRVVKRLLVNRDNFLFQPWLKRKRSIVSAQKVIRGIEANSAISCWQGRLLACISARVLERRDATGPATVLRILDNELMRATAEKVAARFGLTGLFGLDYILEEQTGIPYLIEFNGRATQTCHLNLGAGRDPVNALAHAVAGTEDTDSQKVTSCDTIALFPQEWKRDPASKYLETAYHDVPWEYPGLMRFCMKNHLHERISYAQWVAFWSRSARRNDGSSRPSTQL